MYKIVKYFSIAIFALMIVATSQRPVSAANFSVGQLSISFPGSTLFSATNIAPGYSETKTLTATNNGKVAHSLAIAVDGSLGPLANALHVEPVVHSGGYHIAVWDKTLANIAKYPESTVVVGSIQPGETLNVDFVAFLPLSTGNSYEGTSTIMFNFLMGSETTDPSEPVEIPSNVDIETDSTGGSVNSGQAITSGQPGSGQITEVTSQTNIPNTIEEVQTGSTEGAATSDSNLCYWWWVLLIILAVFLIVYGVVNYSVNRILLGWLWPIFAAAILYFVHWILHDYYTPVKWCPYFVWFEAGELIIYYLIIYLFLNQRAKRAK